MSDVRYVVCAPSRLSAQQAGALCAWFSPHDVYENFYYFGTDRSAWLKFDSPEQAMAYLKGLGNTECEFSGFDAQRAWAAPVQAMDELLAHHTAMAA